MTRLPGMTLTARYLVMLGAITAVSILLAFSFGWPLGLVVAALVVGWPLIGTLITIDDDFPGGFSNPDGKARPEWATLTWYVDILLCRGSIVVAAFAFEYREAIAVAGMLLAVCATMALIGFPRVLRSIRQQPSARETLHASG